MQYWPKLACKSYVQVTETEATLADKNDTIANLQRELQQACEQHQDDADRQQASLMHSIAYTELVHKTGATGTSMDQPVCTRSCTLSSVS